MIWCRKNELYSCNISTAQKTAFLIETKNAVYIKKIVKAKAVINFL